MDDSERTRRAQRREFIRSHHPDRGGDTAAFIAGLARLDREDRNAQAAPRPRVVVVARRPLAVRVAHALLRRRRPHRSRVR